LAITAPQAAAAGTEELEWGEWSTGVFARAKAENRFVLLDLGSPDGLDLIEGRDRPLPRSP